MSARQVFRGVLVAIACGLLAPSAWTAGVSTGLLVIAFLLTDEPAR